MEFWFHEYDRESFEKIFLKVDYLKYINLALSSLPIEEIEAPLQLSENRIERLIQNQLLEQQDLLVSFFNDLNSQIDGQKYYFKDFIRITKLYLQLERLYIQQYWEFDLLKDFLMNRLFSSLLRFLKFVQSFHNSICVTKLKMLKSSEIDESPRLKKNTLLDFFKKGELLVHIEDLVPFQQYFHVSLESLAKSLDRSLSTALSKERLFINQLVYIMQNFLDQDLQILLQDCKFRYSDCESYLINKILTENSSDLLSIQNMQKELDMYDKEKPFKKTEKDLSTLDAHELDLIIDGLLEQYNPSTKKNNQSDILEQEKGFSRKGTASGSGSILGGLSLRESMHDSPVLIGSQKNLANSKRKTKMKGNDMESQRKTVLNQEDHDKKSKNSSYSLNLFQNNLNSQKKNSRMDNSLKVKFGQRTTPSTTNREKSDSITETPKHKEVVIVNNNTTKLGALFDKDEIGNLYSLQPQIEYQKNLISALETNRYKDSPNFIKHNYENPLLRYITLSTAENEENTDDIFKNSKNSMSIYASLGLLDRGFSTDPKKNIEIDKKELFLQMNEKLNENLLMGLLNGTNLAEIRPEEIKFDRFDEKNEEKDAAKRKKDKKSNDNGKNDEEIRGGLHLKNLTTEEDKNKKKDNFFSRQKNQKKDINQKFKRIEEKDFITIDENTQIKGKLEYEYIDEQSPTEIKDHDLFDLNYKSEDEAVNWISESGDGTFAKMFKKLEKEEMLRFVKMLTPNNSKLLWKKLSNSLISDINFRVVSKILSDKITPEIKRRDFNFKKKHKLIVCNIFGQNLYV